MKTTHPKPAPPKWFVIDAEGQNLGRLAVYIAAILRGKNRIDYSPHQLQSDHVIVINAEKLYFHPTKHRRKIYVKHTGYIGHLKTWSLSQMIERRPTRMIEKAVQGMLPKNTLRLEMLKRLHVFAGTEHPHAPQKPETLPKLVSSNSL